jgi:hypothetical protein
MRDINKICGFTAMRAFPLRAASLSLLRFLGQARLCSQVKEDLLGIENTNVESKKKKVSHEGKKADSMKGCLC